MRAFVIGLVLLPGLLAVAPVQARRDPLPPPVAEALAAAGLPEDALSGFITPLHGVGPRWERDADQPVQPGSTMKLVTSAVALDRLGPNLRGRTELLSAAPVDGEVLRGDLVLRGGADPELGWAELWQLLNDLRDQGVRRIEGDLILDRSLFFPTRPDLGVPPFDEAPDAYYNVIPDALHLGGSLLGIEVSADSDRITARTLPRLDGLELRSVLVPTAGRCNAWSAEWLAPDVQDDGQRVRVELRGGFPRGCTIRTALQLIDRDRLAELVLRTLWTRLGGTLDGRVREGTAASDARVLVRRLARTWGEVLRPLNKQSDNALTRLLYLQLGAASATPATGPGGEPVPTADRARAEVLRWMAERRIDSTGLVLDNGSGLSRSERLTPRQLALLLRHALTGPQGPDLLMSLPAVGVDGTMRNRLKASPAAGWARLKTGTLRNVTALAGLVPDDKRQPWLFVAIVNHEAAGRARPALDALVDWVARGLPLPARRTR